MLVILVVLISAIGHVASGMQMSGLNHETADRDQCGWPLAGAGDTRRRQEFEGKIVSALFGLNTGFQTTLNGTVQCSGIGLHTGALVRMTLAPAATGTGIVFIRSDLAETAAPGDERVQARHDAVTETMLGTTVANAAGTSVATVEHLMAALVGCGIDNLEVTLDGPEIPIMDGSAAPFVFLIECAGVAISDRPRAYLRILESVSIEDGPKYAELAPLAGPEGGAADGFSAGFEIDFDTPVIGRQRYGFDLSSAAFKTEICRARTFGFLKDVEQLKALGLARGGSLDNAIVIDDGAVLNEDGLRYPDEFVRHKLLDALGDLGLGGGQILGRFTGRRSGHDLNNRLLHKLFATPGAWRWETRDGEQVMDFAETRRRAGR